MKQQFSFWVSMRQSPRLVAALGRLAPNRLKPELQTEQPPAKMRTAAYKAFCLTGAEQDV